MIKIWTTTNPAMDTVSFRGIKRDGNNTFHINTDKYGLAYELKEEGLHVDSFMELRREEAIEFLKSMVECARDFGIKIPEDEQNTLVDTLKEDKDWMKGIIEKLTDPTIIEVNNEI